MTTPAGRHLFLVGMMGAGKSSTGRALAQKLNRPFHDTDAEVERAFGRSVAEIFATDGEAAFRAAERRALAQVAASPVPTVVALGGGAVLDPQNRMLLGASGDVVWLRAAPATLARRVGDGRSRPLLGSNAPETIARLADERRPLYEEVAAGSVVDVDELSPGEAASAVHRSLLRRVPVALAERAYDVIVGPGARFALADVLPSTARRAVVVTQAGVPVAVETGLPTTRVEIGEGERAKSLATVETCCRAFVEAGLTRADVVVGVGGGMVTDVAGFAAACYHRGVAVVQVATTLLAQVDAAIGGKTGVNLPEGKNLVGAFWQPEAVLCDTDVLATLPEREWRSGLGEMAKYAFLGVDDLDRLPLAEQVARCVEAKAKAVSADERDGGARMLLNYGHTLAHALEAAGLAEDGPGQQAELRHGEAVAIGLVFAARIAEAMGRIGPERVRRHQEVVRGYGLPERLPAGADPDRLLWSMSRDKKATSGLTFVLDGPVGVEVVRGVDPTLVRKVLSSEIEESEVGR